MDGIRPVGVLLLFTGLSASVGIAKEYTPHITQYDTQQAVYHDYILNGPYTVKLSTRISFNTNKSCVSI